MKKLFLFAFCLTWQMIPAEASGPGESRFAFDTNGEFTIVQFTDFHWNPTSAGRHRTAETVRAVLEAERPDLVILSGDVVTAPPAVDGWLEIAGIFGSAGIPWTVTLGNHDDEPGITRDEIFDLLTGKPGFVGEKGPSDVSGVGNFTLPIKASTGERTAAVIYCMDSNGYPALSKHGSYDWIHHDQIVWYSEQSNRYTAQNSGEPLPALAFFHIPTPEFLNVAGRENTFGTKNEGVASARINSGMHAAMIEAGDVMGVFVGHDHDNDYIGVEYDIALAFGRTTGADAYGDLTRGGRVIRLHEDDFRFDTWIRTPKGAESVYHFPSGISTADEQRMNYLPAADVTPTGNGVNYSYYEGRFSSVRQISRRQPTARGTAGNFTLQPATARDHFAFVFEAWLDVPERGVYNFYTRTDDGSRLIVDDTVVVDNDGSHSTTRRNGKIALEKGFHRLILLYFDDHMGEKLEVGFSSRNIRETSIPDRMLFLRE